MQSEIEYEVIFHFVIAISHVVVMKLEVKEKVKKHQTKKLDFMMRKSKKKLVITRLKTIPKLMILSYLSKCREIKYYEVQSPDHTYIVDFNTST